MGLLFDFNQNVSDQRNIHQPYEVYSPQYAPKKTIQADYSYAPSIFIESPNSQGATVTTKKDANLSGATTNAPSESNSPTAALGGGTDIWTIALIAGAALIGIYFISRRK